MYQITDNDIRLPDTGLCKRDAFLITESQDKFIRATQIVPDEDLSPETSISLFGHVLDRHCKPISNATVDVWYAGGKPGEVLDKLCSLSILIK